MWGFGQLKQYTADHWTTRRSASLLATIFLLVAMCGQSAVALSAGDLQGLQVVGHHFSTRVSDGRRVSRVKNPLENRYLIVKLALAPPSSRSPVFLTDFVLQYVRSDGKHARSPCRELCRANTATLGEKSRCMMGTANALIFDKTQKYMTLAFLLANNVREVNIARTGAAPISYTVGVDRPYSVYLTTNQGRDAIAPAQAAIRAGGYQVTNVSDKLSSKSKGIVIHHSTKAEPQAREISQRIMTEMGVVPTVKTVKLISDHDIVVWIGQ